MRSRRGGQEILLLSLPLLVFGILANDPHNTLTPDDFAIVAQFLYR